MVTLQAAITAIALSATGQTALLDFYSDSCVPCRQMEPVVRALEAAGYPVQRVNVGLPQNRPIVERFQVRQWPCYVMVVNGQEVDRVLGGTTHYRLEQMCKLAAQPPVQNRPATMLAGTVPTGPPQVTPVSLPPAAVPAANEWRPENSGAVDLTRSLPATLAAPRVASVSDAALLAASVRLRIEDPTGHSCGSGTIIDARCGNALILTCGHIFRESRGKGRIDVDVFGPNGPQRIEGVCDSYDLNRDIGLVVIKTPGPVAVARIAPPGYRIQRGAPVVTVGCNGGDAPSIQHSRVTALDAAPNQVNLWVAGQPVEGRSGGGLFSAEGYVIGVCNAADPVEKEGLFAELSAIYTQLDRKDTAGGDLSFVYKSPGSSAAPAAPAAIVANVLPPPQQPPYTPGSIALASSRSASPASAEASAGLLPHEQAALDEIHRSLKEGAEVTIVVRHRDKPAAKSEVFQLDHASPDFLKRLSGESRPQEGPYPTSLELPKSRNILLEWSAERQMQTVRGQQATAR